MRGRTVGARQPLDWERILRIFVIDVRGLHQEIVRLQESDEGKQVFKGGHWSSGRIMAARKTAKRMTKKEFLKKKTRSVVDDTFAALPIKKHAQIEQLIEQTKYGE